MTAISYIPIGTRRSAEIRFKGHFVGFVTRETHQLDGAGLFYAILLSNDPRGPKFVRNRCDLTETIEDLVTSHPKLPSLCDATIEPSIARDEQ